MRNANTGKRRSVGKTGPITKPRVHAGEWLVGAGGLAVLAGLFMAWSGGETSFETFSLLKLLVLAMAVAALALPPVVASSSRTNLPISWETFLSTGALLVLVLLLLRLLWPPADGLDTGFFVVLAGTVLITAAGWRSVARES